jgi:hypothetical protein
LTGFSLSDMALVLEAVGVKEDVDKSTTAPL